MPRSGVPRYRLHSARNLAAVTLRDAVTGRRKTIYLGAFDSPESRSAYVEAIKAWEAAGRRLIDTAHQEAAFPVTAYTVVELCADYLDHARGYYSPGEVAAIVGTIRLLRAKFGEWPAGRFDVLALRALRDEMLRLNWTRTRINRVEHHVRRIFRWGASMKRVPAGIVTELSTLSALRRGRSSAPETEPVRPAADAHVTAIEPHVSRAVWSMVQLQLLNGARAGELLRLRAIDFDTSGEIWLTRLVEHKTAHHGHARVLAFGPRAQAIIRPFMADRAVDAFLFNPRESLRERRAATSEGTRRPGQATTPRRTERRVGECFTTAAYRRAIRRACALAGVPTWSPHQLRHNAATSIEREFGLEFAQRVLGHSSAKVTDAVYAERDLGKVLAVARKIG